MIDRPIVISLYDPRPDGRPTHETGRVSARFETTVQELLTSLTDHCEAAAKHLAPAWSPIAYRGQARKATDAESVCALAYDFDHPEALDFPALGERLASLQWIYAVHETYTRGRARLVLPLARDLEPREYASAYREIALQLGVWGSVDQTCADLARLFYAPSRPAGEERLSESGGSVLLDPPRAGHTAPKLRVVPNPPPAAKTENSPSQSSEKFFDLSALRAEIEDYSGAHKRGLQELVDGTLRVPPGQRESLLHPLLSAFGALRHAPPDGVMTEMLSRVLSVRDGADTHLEDWIVKAMYSYTRAQEYTAKREEANAVVENFFRDESWRTGLKQIIDKNGAVKGLKVSESNVLKVLRNDDAWRGHLRWNMLKQRVELTGGALAGLHENARESYAMPAAEWFQDSAYNCEVSRDIVGACMEHVALENPYDPVHEYLKSLPKWDGEVRLPRILTKYASAQGDPEWVALVSRKFFIAACARAEEPGCQVDNVLVLQGAQGGGKTSLVRIMGAGFAVETSLDLQNKDAVMTAAGNWLVELGELASLKKAEVEHVRNFITRREDQIRLPYGRSVKAMPRRCVFIGTTNSRQPLTDPEGNRRYWVVSVGDVDTEALARDRDQLWAEALHYYRQGEQWHLTREQSIRAAKEAKVYETEDVSKQEILQWMFNAKEWPTHINALTVLQKVMQRPVGSIMPHEAMGINRVLGTFGWTRTRLRVNRVLTYAYEVPPKEEVERALDAAYGMDNVTKNPNKETCDGSEAEGED